MSIWKWFLKWLGYGEKCVCITCEWHMPDKDATPLYQGTEFDRCGHPGYSKLNTTNGDVVPGYCGSYNWHGYCRQHQEKG